MTTARKADQLPNCEILMAGSSLSGKVTLAKRVADLAEDKQKLRIELVDSLSQEQYFEHPHMRLFVLVISCLEHLEDLQAQIRAIPQVLIARNLVYVVLSKSDLHTQRQLDSIGELWLQEYNSDIPVVHWYNSVQKSTDQLAKGIIECAKRPLAMRALNVYAAKMPSSFEPDAEMVGKTHIQEMGIITERRGL